MRGVECKVWRTRRGVRGRHAVGHTNTIIRSKQPFLVHNECCAQPKRQEQQVIGTVPEVVRRGVQMGAIPAEALGGAHEQHARQHGQDPADDFHSKPAQQSDSSPEFLSEESTFIY